VKNNNIAARNMQQPAANTNMSNVIMGPHPESLATLVVAAMGRTINPTGMAKHAANSNMPSKNGHADVW
jgi:hypothetical protein